MSANNDYDLCTAIANMGDNILGAGIIEDLRLVTMYAKPNVRLPEEEKFKLMFAQSEMLISIAGSNADFFGRIRYLVSSFENSDAIFFPFTNKSNNKNRTLVIQILRPYDHERIAEKITDRLKQGY